MRYIHTTQYVPTPSELVASLPTEELDDIAKHPEVMTTFEDPQDVAAFDELVWQSLKRDRSQMN